MKHFPLSGTLPLLALVSMTACVDENYDLSDIDTTTEIKVKDLILPVKIDPIKLGDIISVEKDSEFNTIQIGNQTVYAVNTRGSFSSKAIKIPSFSAAAPDVTGITIAFAGGTTPLSRSGELDFPLAKPEITSVEYQASDIDESIIAIEALATENFNITVAFDASSVAGLASLELTDLKLTLPKGLIVTDSYPADLTYSSSDGVTTIPSLALDANGKGEISLIVAGLSNMEANGYVLNKRTLSIYQEITVAEAILKVTPTGNVDGNLDSIAVDVNFRFSDLTATSFSGKVRYAVSGINIEPVEISDLPDFLAGSETDIVLANPQIYLNLNNPVGEYNLMYQSGINIIPVRDGVAGNALSLDNNETFKVNNGTDFTNLYLSPNEVSHIPSGFTTPMPVHYPFSSLSDAIAGDGIPQELRIELVNPEIPEQNVVDFRLGETLPGVEGNWEFLAPLAFKNGTKSTIFYTADGWNDEEVDAIHIDHLAIGMTVDNTLPVGLTITGYPIDKEGKDIALTENKSIEVNPGATGEKVMLDMKGNITHLDGIRLKVELGSGNEEALSPDQTITLTDIKAQVSGNYTKKF